MTGCRASEQVARTGRTSDVEPQPDCSRLLITTLRSSCITPVIACLAYGAVPGCRVFHAVACSPGNDSPSQELT